jgi:hypothetical protein
MHLSNSLEINRRGLKADRDWQHVHGIVVPFAREFVLNEIPNLPEEAVFNPPI